MAEPAAPLVAKQVAPEDLPWIINDDPGRRWRVFRLHFLDYGIAIPMILYVFWFSGGSGPYFLGALFFLLAVAVGAYEAVSKTVKAHAIGTHTLHIKTRTKSPAIGVLKIEKAEALQRWRSGPTLRLLTTSGQKLEFFTLEPRRLEELIKDIDYARRKARGEPGLAPAAAPPQTAAAGPGAPAVSWAVAISPAGETIPDNINQGRTRYDINIPVGRWESMPQRQELAVHALSAVISFSIFAAVLLFVFLAPAGVNLGRDEFCLASFALGTVVVVLFRKRIGVGERGRSSMFLPEGFGHVSAVGPIVLRAVARGGWRIESEEVSGDHCVWRLDIPIKLVLSRSSSLPRSYLRLETMGRAHRGAHARLKGRLVKEFEAAALPATPPAPAAQEGNPPESGGVEDPTPAK